MNWFLLYWFSKSISGAYFEFIAIISILGAVMFGGYAKYVLREAAIDASNIWSYSRSIRAWVGIGIITSCVSVVLLIVVDIFSFEYAMYLIWMPFLAYLTLVSALLRGLGSHIYGNIEAGVIRPIVFMMIVLVVVYAGVEIGLKELLIFGLISLFVDSFIMRGILEYKKRDESKVVGSCENNYKSIFKLSAISLVEVLYLNLDLVVIAVLLKQEDVAVYKVVLLLRSLLLLPTMTFNMLMPYLLSSGMVTPKHLVAIRIINLLLGLFGFLINWNYGIYFVSLLFGDGYEVVPGLLQPFFIMMIVLAVSGPSLEYLVAKKKESVVLFIISMSIAFSFSFNLIFHEEYGLLSFSVSSAFSYAAAHLISEIYRRKFI
jgi:O-antigen/teichoic acid export membrane protein